MVLDRKTCVFKKEWSLISPRVWSEVIEWSNQMTRNLGSIIVGTSREVEFLYFLVQLPLNNDKSFESNDHDTRRDEGQCYWDVFGARREEVWRIMASPSRRIVSLTERQLRFGIKQTHERSKLESFCLSSFSIEYTKIRLPTVYKKTISSRGFHGFHMMLDS